MFLREKALVFYVFNFFFHKIVRLIFINLRVFKFYILLQLLIKKRKNKHFNKFNFTQK